MIKSSLKSFYNRFSSLKQFQRLAAICVVVIVAGIGTYLLSTSHAASPYGSADADKGTLTGVANSQTCAGADDGNCVQFGTASTTIGAGQNYQICSKQSQYLTSPWTYDALSSGSQNYTVAEYEALPGYSTTLPPLPSYVSSEPAGTEAAVIYAPTSSNVNLPSYEFPVTPLLFFFEGGVYSGGMGASAVAGDQFIGGSVSGYGEPEVTSNNQYGNISAENASYDWQGTGTPSTSLATLSSSASQGATTLSTGPASAPIVPWEWIAVANTGGTYDHLQVKSISGTESGGYSLTLAQPVNLAASSGTTVYYGGPASDVTVQYLNIGGGAGNTTISLLGFNSVFGSGWTIDNNDIHDDYAGGANWDTTNAAGVAVYGGDNSTVDYNCFQRLGEYATAVFGSNPVFAYNQVDSTPYNPDLSGNGQTACGKWWATTNAGLLDNAFTDEGYTGCVWFDNGNTGQLVQGNYFYNDIGNAVANETGYNMAVCGNLFDQVGSAVYSNDSGGWDIPGSNYNKETLIGDPTASCAGNTFNNVLTAITIWGASGRSCLNSGEGGPESAAYCSGGFPQQALPYNYFTHYTDSTINSGLGVLANQTCSSSSPCTTVTVAANGTPINQMPGVPGIDDFVGFSTPVQTTTSQTTNVTTCTSVSPCTVTVGSTTGFPSSGQFIANTSTGALYTSTGAVMSYTGTSGSDEFTGVVLVSGSGSLGTAVTDQGTLTGTIESIQPYKVTAESCPGGNCKFSLNLTVSPAITSNLTTSEAIYNTGTCAYYDTSAATPTSPMAPAYSDSTDYSYYDGCMWQDRNITASGNTFLIDAASFNSASYPAPVGGTWGGSANTCTTGASGNCGEVQVGYQYPGGNIAPYDNTILSNAFMSNSSFSSPLNNLNGSGSPLVGSNSYEALSGNGETPYNNDFSGNTYTGTWTFQAFTLAAGCPVSWSGNALDWVGVGLNGNACAGLSLAQWQSYWHQD